MQLWRRKGASTADMAPVAEAVPDSGSPQVSAIPGTRGYLAGIPLGGTTRWNPGSVGSASRREYADELYGAYMACTWASACVDVIARTVTAGGLDVVPEDEEVDAENPPLEVVRLKELFDFVNPRENIKQLLTGVVTDLLVFGDAFVEIVYLAGTPVALYTLDSPSMIPLSDEHGNVSGYTQQLDPQRTADFAPNEVLHFTMGGPRSGLYGIGAIQKAELPIRAWLFTAGLLKETMRKGNPPRVHIDYPAETANNAIEADREKWEVSSLGIPNVGMPFMTKGGAKAVDLKVAAITEYISTLDQKRNEIIASMGVPPRKLSIAEPGQLGGTGEGTVSDKTFRVNTCGPLGERLLEVVNYGLAFLAYGITGWDIKLGEVDYRDDQQLEEIYDRRLKNGGWTLNRYLRQIGEPEIGPAGDIHIMVERQLVIDWEDIEAYSKALVASPAATGQAPEPDNPDEPPDPNDPKTPKTPKDSKAPKESTLTAVKIREAAIKRTRGPDAEEAALVEAWTRDYQQRRRRALRELPKVPA